MLVVVEKEAATTTTTAAATTTTTTTITITTITTTTTTTTAATTNNLRADHQRSVGPHAKICWRRINGKIKLSWLNLSYESFKIKCKRLFITNW